MQQRSPLAAGGRQAPGAAGPQAARALPTPRSEAGSATYVRAATDDGPLASILARAVQDRAATVVDPADAARHARTTAAAGNALQRTPGDTDLRRLEDRVTRLENMWRLRDQPEIEPLPFTPEDELIRAMRDSYSSRAPITEEHVRVAREAFERASAWCWRRAWRAMVADRCDPGPRQAACGAR